MTYQDGEYLTKGSLNLIESGLTTALSQAFRKQLTVINLFGALDLDLSAAELFKISGTSKKGFLRVIENLEGIHQFRQEAADLNRFVGSEGGFSTTASSARKNPGCCLSDDAVFFGGGWDNSNNPLTDFYYLPLSRSFDVKSLNSSTYIKGEFNLFAWRNSIIRSPAILTKDPSYTFDVGFASFDIYSDSWRPGLFNPNWNRWRAAMVQIEDLIYYLGGHDQNLTSSDSCSVYDIRNREIFDIDSLPLNLSSSQVCVIDDSIWMMGGWQWDTNLPYKGILRYKIFEDKWSWVRDFTFELRHHRMESIGSNLVVWGTDKDMGWAYVYNPISGWFIPVPESIHSTGQLI